MKRMRSASTIPAMDELEWRSGLKRLNLTHTEAVQLVYYKTGVVLDLTDIYHQFKRFGRLSKNQTALWRLFFKAARRRKSEQAA